MGVDDAENGACSGNFVTEMRKRNAKMFGNTVAVDIVYLLSVSLTPPPEGYTLSMIERAAKETFLYDNKMHLDTVESRGFHRLLWWSESH